MPTDVDLSERYALCDLFMELGPEATTLCGEWKTADLASHLVIRERNPIGMPGILIGGPFETLTDKMMARELGRHGFKGCVSRLREGPPISPSRIRWIGRLINTIEFVVHHEDVRRPTGLGPREDVPLVQDQVWSTMRKAKRLLVAPAHLGSTGLTLRSSGREDIVANGEPETGAVLSGNPVEVLLYLYGRRNVADCELSGESEATEKISSASFGL